MIFSGIFSALFYEGGQIANFGNKTSSSFKQPPYLKKFWKFLPGAFYLTLPTQLQTKENFILAFSLKKKKKKKKIPSRTLFWLFQ